VLVWVREQVRVQVWVWEQELVREQEQEQEQELVREQELVWERVWVQVLFQRVLCPQASPYPWQVP